MLTISVIIATYNRNQVLAEALKSLSTQVRDDSFGFDVIVVDNNSTDNTQNVVDSFTSTFNNKLCYLFEEQQGKSHALNKGIEEASGEIIAFTDDDALVDAGWLANIAQCFANYPCDGLGGRIVPQYPSNTPRWIQDNKDLIVGPVVNYDYGEETKIYRKPMLEFLGANFAFKKSLFKECGLFRTDIGPGKEVLGEDTEITNRFLKAGKRLYYCGNALVRHPVEFERMTLKYITAWYVALGRYRIIAGQHEALFECASYVFGIPNSLMKRIISEAMYFLTHVYSRREMLRGWVDLCISFGKVSQIKRSRKIRNKIL